MTKKTMYLVSALGILILSAIACNRDKPTAPNLTVDETLSSLAAKGAAANTSSGWGYGDDDGPAVWCDLDPSFSLCCGGVQQSPVNITRGALKKANLPALDHDYESHADLEVINNGHTVEAEVHSGDGTLTIEGKAFELIQFHWHARSEHAVNGRLLPMEMHLVHQASDGALAVVGVLIVKGQKNTELDKIWQVLPQNEGDEVEVEGFDLNELLPNTAKTIRYPGSLTTPPCSESVSWNLYARPIEMSENQIQDFVNIFSGPGFPHGNRRPTQPLNGRKLLTDLSL